MNQRQHILFINHTREFHGAERVLVESIRIAKTMGYRVTVVVPNIVADNGFEKECTPYCDELIRLSYRGGGIHLWRTLAVLLYNIPALWRLYKYVHNEQVTCIYSNTYVTLIGSILAHCTHCKHIWHFHEMPNKGFGWHSSMCIIYRRLITASNNQIIFISHQQQQAWLQTLNCTFRYDVVYNPLHRIVIDSKDTHTAIRVGYLGSFEPRKNLACLIQVMESICTTNPQVELWLCGAQNKDEIRQLYAQTTLSQAQLHVLPATKDVDSFYTQIDIFVLPSLYETMPLVALEAKQAGVCVIQTNQSGLTELLEDKKDCYFFTPTNQHQLKQLIQHCLDIEIRDQIAQQGQQTVLHILQNHPYHKQIESLFS